MMSFVFLILANKSSDGEVARAKTGIVFLDYASRKIVGVPEQFKRRFEHRPGVK